MHTFWATVLIFGDAKLSLVWNAIIEVIIARESLYS